MVVSVCLSQGAFLNPVDQNILLKNSKLGDASNDGSGESLDGGFHMEVVISLLLLPHGMYVSIRVSFS